MDSMRRQTYEYAKYKLKKLLQKKKKNMTAETRR